MKEEKENEKSREEGDRKKYVKTGRKWQISDVQGSVRGRTEREREISIDVYVVYLSKNHGDASFRRLSISSSDNGRSYLSDASSASSALASTH